MAPSPTQKEGGVGGDEVRPAGRTIGGPGGGGGPHYPQGFRFPFGLPVDSAGKGEFQATICTRRGKRKKGEKKPALRGS